MKALKTLLLAVTVVFVVNASAQDESNSYTSKKNYWSIEGEMIFSFAEFETAEEFNVDQNMRWSPVFNLAGHYNYDLSDNFGLNVGLAIRNVGFIVKSDNLSFSDPNVNRKKHRTYNLGIPIGLKVGNLNQDKPFFLFGGFELEFPFHYKEKSFAGSEKTNVTTGWFSDRVESFQQSTFVDIQFPQGFSIKAKYYLTQFFNKDFTEVVRVSDPLEDITINPSEIYNANIFYFSLTWFPFQDLEYAKSKYM